MPLQIILAMMVILVNPLPLTIRLVLYSAVLTAIFTVTVCVAVRRRREAYWNSFEEWSKIAHGV